MGIAAIAFLPVRHSCRQECKMRQECKVRQASTGGP